MILSASSALDAPGPVSSAAPSEAPEFVALHGLQQALASGNSDAIRQACDRLEACSTVALDPFWLARVNAGRAVADQLECLARGLVERSPLVTLSAYESLCELKACPPLDVNWDELLALVEAGRSYRSFLEQVEKLDTAPGELFQLGRELERCSPGLLTVTARLRIELSARLEGACLRLRAAVASEDDRLITEAYQPALAAAYTSLTASERARLALALLRLTGAANPDRPLPSTGSAHNS